MDGQPRGHHVHVTRSYFLFPVSGVPRAQGGDLPSPAPSRGRSHGSPGCRARGPAGGRRGVVPRFAVRGPGGFSASVAGWRPRLRCPERAVLGLSRSVPRPGSFRPAVLQENRPSMQVPTQRAGAATHPPDQLPGTRCCWAGRGPPAPPAPPAPKHSGPLPSQTTPWG